ncbi:helicase-like transcription factor CHR28, partial [Tanacetum coccineum]
KVYKAGKRLLYVKRNKAISLGNVTSKVGIEVHQLSLKDCTWLKTWIRYFIECLVGFAMEAIDINITTNNVSRRVLPSWASSSNDKGSHGSRKRPHPSSKNPTSSSSNTGGNVKRIKVTINHGTNTDDHLPDKIAKRILPSYLQPSPSSSSRLSSPVKDVGRSSQMHEKILPPWMKSPTSGPAAPFGGQSDPYRPGVVQETHCDERQIYQVALQDLNQPVIEATVPKDSVCSSLQATQILHWTWVASQKGKTVCACLVGILADDQMQRFSSQPKFRDYRVSEDEALDLESNEPMSHLATADKDYDAEDDDREHKKRKVSNVSKKKKNGTKDTVIDGQPIITLPPKTIKLSSVDFSTEERDFYSKLEADSCSQFKAYAAAGTVRQNYANILLMLLRLRQACDHPLLVKGLNSESASQVSTKMAKNLPREMQVNLLNILETLNICHLCNDPPEDAAVTLCGTIGGDAVFTKSTLLSCTSNDYDDQSLVLHNDKSLVLHNDKSLVHNVRSSSKIKATLEIIESNCRSNNPIKTIVFSQWTKMLDLVETALNQHYIEYRRLDGSMSLPSRDRAVKEFNTDPEVAVMLMSLKAGNLGLNMVSASHVILLDLWWNPATEDQAVDRAHRIGQTRSVTVSRLTIKDTVEDRILALQEEKRKMVASAFGEDRGGSSAPRLTAEDLKFLFMGSY